MSNRVKLSLSAAFTERLQQFAHQQGTTLAITVLGGWGILLGRWSGQEEISVTVQPAVPKHLQGESANTFSDGQAVLRVTIEEDATVQHVLRQLTAAVADMYARRKMLPTSRAEKSDPFNLLHSVLEMHAGLFGSAELKRPVRTLHDVPTAEMTARLALLPISTRLEEGQALVLELAGDSLDREMTERMAACLQVQLEGMALNPLSSVSRLPMLPPIERERVLYAFNDTEVAGQKHRLVHHLFEEQVNRSPNAVSLVYEHQCLTYAQLNRRANQLARYLIERGVRAEQLVGMYVERNADLVVGMLGTLKAGAGYLPLDPSQPSERLAHVLTSAAPTIVLTQRRLVHKLPTSAADVVVLDDCWSEIFGRESENLGLLWPQPTEQNLAYVIFTSGSTGEPKGVVAEHRGVVNRVAAQAAFGAFSESDVCCIKTSIGFVDSIFEILAPLCYGRPLVLVPSDATRNVQQLASQIKMKGITRLVTVPALAQSLLEGGEVVLSLQTLRRWTLSGEELKAELLRRLKEQLPQCAFTNLYGASEVAADATCHVCDTCDVSSVSIGRPIANMQIYVLNSHLEPVPVGVAGEIYIGGAGVARGYLNRPHLTAERFIANPFRPDVPARLYRSGDAGLWRSDGTLEYLGRTDRQVKLRGIRIELNEIEQRLASHSQVHEAVVVMREVVPGEKRLIAYVTGRNGKPPSPDMLRGHLTMALPDYMVPSAIVTLERLPQTASGKLDRKALPTPDLCAYASRPYEAPQGKTEEILAAIWRELLQVERVGRHDNFFELNGHSLLILRMIERLRRTGLSVEAHRVFENPTLASLASTLKAKPSFFFRITPNLIPPGCEAITPQMLPLVALEQNQIELIVDAVPGGVSNVQDIYPLAPLQEGILFHYFLDEQGDDTYVLTTVLSVSSRTRLKELIAALQEAVDRHDILRTQVVWKALPRPVQLVCRRAVLPVEEFVLDPNGAPIEQIRGRIRSRPQRMDLRHAPLMRLEVAADPNSGQWFVVLQRHHIVEDDESQKILISEVVAHLQGRAGELPPPVPFRNHVANVLAHGRRHDAEAFFRTKLGDVAETTAPFGLLDVQGGGGRIEDAHQLVSVALTQRVRTCARRLSVSSAMLWHVGWAIVVAGTSRRNDVVFGSVLLGRFSSAARTVGMFVNTLPLRLRLYEVSVEELVRRAHREMQELLRHEQASLAEAQRCSGMVGSFPLFTTVLNYRQEVVDLEIEWAKAGGIQVLETLERTNYPITVSIDELSEEFRLTVQTDRRIDPHRVAAYVLTAIHSLVEALETSPQMPALALSILPKYERHQVIGTFNATGTGYSREKLVHEFFESQVERTSDAAAVVHEDQKLTYADLNGRANCLARYLRVKGVGPGQLVAICVNRSVEMLVGLLGILKAGAAYVPLDPSYPSERLLYMLEDAAPKLVLTQDKLRSTLPGNRIEVVSLDGEWEEIEAYSEENIPIAELGLTSQSRVYVIYTSGSTGRPKGTEMAHQSMINLIEWHYKNLSAGEGKRVLQFAALSFDVAFQEIFSTLCTGGVLVLLDEWVRRDARALAELLSSHSIQRLFVPPLMLQSLSEHFKTASGVPESLQDVITAGEQLRISPEISGLFKRLSGCRLHNHYGPTESHVVTALTLSGDPGEWPMLPAIGQPISNTQIYVMDAQRRPAPIGVAGEIYIGGANVARGYLNRPELTAERFLADPFSADAPARLYRTGDLGRWRADGTLEYLGRNDDQVKIRGHRVELGEIEALLASHEQVLEAAVIAREDVPGATRLVGYVTADQHSGLSVEELHAHLESLVPEYMVPSAFVIMGCLPLTPSGKLDRRALPMPDIEAYVREDYEPPQGEVEEAIAKIWQELLHVERVGRDDNFFKLGGHSLLATRVMAHIRHVLDFDLPLRVLFEKPTVEGLANRIMQEVAAEVMMEEP